ncbi:MULTISPECIES: NAD(P)/FAD-dependent oxidoreductase [unclassified Bosea (in: a-proteobacteria)]|uniref:NAD(P)/FAD-dependent oxidoreductase n=1 Tax=unclassified Bosea (in: a-proteobacteria) TaxID=2653178 RepID=UPI000F7594B8|nr:MULTISPECIES: NAD(P)/FAD-dependent oxidoreductase [unclassified Bosea (in: a-proteobacteria)]AZO82049.1 thioredoxin reductase [Bosea sp. Tri-49]RXT24622.1 thioredoxin reductase [Bosea sp. Tri-39]RXT42457.1 thioredoxin reductase [Bosea sp. Tri-54]
MPEQLDCLIIGGGPAGLTAAIYLARFHLTVAVADGRQSRALQITCSQNHAGFPNGISGRGLLTRMRAQAVRYGSQIVDCQIDEIDRDRLGFSARGDGHAFSARSVLIATGVTNCRPPIDDALHAEALSLGRLRYCPVCDGYEVTGQDVGVIGSDARAAKECEFLRSFTDRVSLVLNERGDLPGAIAARLTTIGVRVIGGPAQDFQLEAGGLSMSSATGRVCFEAVYPALGSVVHSELATLLGAAVTEDGCIKVDSHQRTSIAGLYAAGDVVIGLDQISHAMGEAGVAATTIRNDLALSSPRFR